MGNLNIIRKEGKFSRVLTVTKVIPADWRAVELSVLKQKDGYLIIKVDKVG